MGVPTLPTAMALSPAACSMDSVRPTVVVLPLVPVMVSQSAVLRPSRTRTRQASSTSPQTGMWARAAAASSAWSGRQPGEVTIRSGFMPSILGTVSDGVLAEQDVHGADDPQGVRLGLGAFGLVAASTTTTRAPSSIRVSAAAKPETPMPVTTTRSPAQSESQLTRSLSRGDVARCRNGPVTAGPPILRRRYRGPRRRTARRGSRTGPRR